MEDNFLIKFSLLRGLGILEDSIDVHILNTYITHIYHYWNPESPAVFWFRCSDLSCSPPSPSKQGFSVTKSQGLTACQHGIIARLIVLNNQLGLFISIINSLLPAPPASSCTMAARCFPDARKASFVGFLHSHQAGCEDA